MQMQKSKYALELQDDVVKQVFEEYRHEGKMTMVKRSGLQKQKSA